MSFCLEQKIKYSRKITIFKRPSNRFLSHMGAPGKKCSRPPVRKVGSTMNKNTLSPIPSTTANMMIACSSFLLDRCFSSHSSNLEGWAVSSSG